MNPEDLPTLEQFTSQFDTLKMLGAELNTLDDQLGVLIVQFELKLKELKLGVPFGVVLDEEHTLRYQKVSNVWRLCIVHPQGEFRSWLSSASRQVRYTAVCAFGRLLLAAEEALAGQLLQRRLLLQKANELLKEKP